jgi:hypothetical protein
MGRKSEFETESKNPSEKFLTWSSTNKCLRYYDKKNSKEVFIKLPFSFLTLAERTTVKGFDKKNNIGIYSNEVKYLNENLKVKNFKSRNIAEGIWNDISSDVDKAGGKFAKSIYAMTKKGSLINICFFGGAIGEWFEFTKKSKKRLADEWVTVDGFEERKSGATTYYIPKFKYNKSLDSIQGDMADKAYEIFQEYENGESHRKKEINQDEWEAREPEIEDKEDDLPF